MANKKKQEPLGLIPKHILNQLVEHTAGGFILFHFNSEDGSPEQVMTFDSPAHCLALQKHIADWSYALQELQVDSEKHNLQVACQKAQQQEDNGDSDSAAAN